MKLGIVVSDSDKLTIETRKEPHIQVAASASANITG